MRSVAKFENIEYEIKRVLFSAKREVYICVAWIRYDLYGHVIRDLVGRGVKVRIICHNDTRNAELLENLKDVVEIYPVQGYPRPGLMHNKFCIVDGRILINGSYNWSRNAPWYFENIIVHEEDFDLIKQFMHEFFDIVDYYLLKSRGYSRCRQCEPRHVRAFNLAVLGDEEGKYRESQVSVWNVCALYWHAEHLFTDYAPLLLSNLGLNGEDDYEKQECIDVESMMEEFAHERREMTRIEEYVNSNLPFRVDAVGVVQISNWDEHTKWGVDPDWVVKIIWKRFAIRKVVPDIIHDNSDGIGDIIMRHK